jgi:hypothetical protein
VFDNIKILNGKHPKCYNSSLSLSLPIILYVCLLIDLNELTLILIPLSPPLSLEKVKAFPQSLYLPLILDLTRKTVKQEEEFEEQQFIYKKVLYLETHSCRYSLFFFFFFSFFCAF